MKLDASSPVETALLCEWNDSGEDRRLAKRLFIYNNLSNWLIRFNIYHPGILALATFLLVISSIPLKPAKTQPTSIACEYKQAYKVAQYYHSFGSPLTPFSLDIVKNARKYGVPVWLVVGTSICESSGGIAKEAQIHRNPFGMLKNGRYIDFVSMREAIKYFCILVGTDSRYGEWRKTKKLHNFTKIFKAKKPYLKYENIILRVKEKFNNG